MYPIYVLLDYVGYIKTKTLFIGGAIMQSEQQANQQELYSSYASEDEMIMTEEIENLLNEWLNEFETQQQEDTTSKFP